MASSAVVRISLDGKRGDDYIDICGVDDGCIGGFDILGLVGLIVMGLLVLDGCVSVGCDHVDVDVDVNYGDVDVGSDEAYGNVDDIDISVGGNHGDHGYVGVGREDGYVKH